MQGRKDHDRQLRRVSGQRRASSLWGSGSQWFCPQGTLLTSADEFGCHSLQRGFYGS